MVKKAVIPLETLAEKFIEEQSKGKSFSSVDSDFPFGFPICLKRVAESGNKELFQRLVNSYVSYSETVNRGSMNQQQIKLEALDFIEFQCMVGDTGRMTVGIPPQYKTDGPARKMFLDIYLGQLARDLGYVVTHSIQI